VLARYSDSESVVVGTACLLPQISRQYRQRTEDGQVAPAEHAARGCELIGADSQLAHLAAVHSLSPIPVRPIKF